MKKIYCVILFLISASLIFLTACSKDENQTFSEPTKVTESSDIEKATEPEITSPPKTLFKKFEEKLTRDGYSFKKVSKAAAMIGAKQGIEYQISTGAAELYVFDKESEAYKAAEKEQAIQIEGFGAVEAIVKNGAALIMSDLNEYDTKKIEETFNIILG